MLEPKAPLTRNGPNTGSLAPGVRRRVNNKKKLFAILIGPEFRRSVFESLIFMAFNLSRISQNFDLFFVLCFYEIFSGIALVPAGPSQRKRKP